MTSIKTIDTEVSGEALRLVTEGGPTVIGRSMSQKLVWLKRHGEDLRTRLMLEPRGHAGMHGAMLTEPVSLGAHAGILFMNAGGFPEFSGEGVLGAVRAALENNLIVVGPHEPELLIDTPTGSVRTRPAIVDGRVNQTEIVVGPSYVHTAGLIIVLAGRRIPVDVAYSGGFYAIADGEAIGVPVDLDHAAELTRKAADVREAVTALLQTVNVAGTIFTSQPRAGADLRSATVLEHGVLKRAASVSSTAALLAVLDAMGLIEEGEFVHEGIIGTAVKGRILSRNLQDGIPMVVPEITGFATVTGSHEFVFSS